ncbi:MAG: tyrosine-type recombinase/integrase [Anaeromyxobacteraceae bacterium]
MARSRACAPGLFFTTPWNAALEAIMEKKRRSYGDGEVIPLPNGRYKVRWHEQGRRRSRNFRSLALAERFRRGIVGDIARERAGLPPDPRMFPTLATLAEGWIERRRYTHASWSEDRGRWNNHLAPTFGPMRAGEVDRPALRAFVEEKHREGMNPDTLRNVVRCLSTFMTDLCERPRETGIEQNPCFRLPENLQRLMRSTDDPRLTPYLERLADVRRIFQEMSEPQRVAYAIGVCAGPRPGEILALSWPDVDEEEYRIDVRHQVQDGRLCPVKDKEPRIVQGDFLAPLVPVLRAWRLKTGGRGLLFPPALTATPKKRTGAFMHPKRLTEALKVAAAACELPGIMTWKKPWYQATRHTFATHWLRAGHSLGELAMALGHSSTWVTERYAHIRPSRRGDDDPWKLDLYAPPATVTEIGSCVALDRGSATPHARSRAPGKRSKLGPASRQVIENSPVISIVGPWRNG